MMTTLTAGKIDLKTKIATRDKERYYIMITVSIHQVCNN